MVTKLNINNTVLLVVDVNNQCCHEKCEVKKWGITFKKIRKIVPSIKSFISKYRNAGGKIIFVKCLPWQKKFLPKNIIELYTNPLCKYYSTDKTEFNESLFELRPEKKDLIITKNTYDAFTNPKLDKFLQKNKIQYVVICGVFGDGCISSTIQGGFSAGYNFIILNDLIETTDVPIRQKLQKLLKDYTWPIMFGKTIDSKDFFKIVKKK